jgi:general secretion pathway protein C
MAKKSFWILIFLLATLSAYLAADLVSLNLKTILDVLPITYRTPSKRGKETEKNKNLEQYYKIITQRDLFQIQPTKENGIQGKEEEKVAPITDLNLKLLGTVIGKGILPFAIILDNKTRKQDLYTEGDEVGPAQIIKIYRNKVFLLHNGAEEMLVAFDKMDSSHDTALADSRKSSYKEPLTPQRLPTKLGKKVGQNHWVLNRGEVQDVINNSSQLLTQVRIIPHFQKGDINQPDGFQVANIKPRSLLDTMGLRNGDVIRSVNKQPFNNPEKAFEAYQKFKEESQIEVVVRRNNKDITLRYDIND